MFKAILAPVSATAVPVARRAGRGALFAAGASLLVAGGCSQKSDSEAVLTSGGRDFDDNAAGDGAGGAGSPPEITAVDVTFEADFGGEPALVVRVGFTDADNDVEEGGALEVTVTPEGADPSAFGPWTVGEDPEVQLEEAGVLLFGVRGVSATKGYGIDVGLYDAAGNASDIASGSYAP